MNLKLIFNVFAGLISVMPDSLKTILCKILGLLAVTACVFIAGFYFGYQTKTAAVLEEQVKSNQIINQNMRQQTSEAVKKSEEIALQIQTETQLAYERKEKQKELSEKSGVLKLPLPDRVIRLLNDASSF